MIAERERDDVAEWLDDLLAEWVGKTTKREDGEQFANRVRILFRTARGEKPAVGRFTKYTRPLEAVMDVLNEAGRPLPPEEIKAAVLEGEFKPWRRDRAVDIDKCLGAYAPSAKQTRKALRWLGGFADEDDRWTGGLIGISKWPKDKWPERLRAEWPEERFK